MDGARFDRIVRSLTAAASRRGAITSVVAGLLATLAPDADSEAARRRNQRKSRRRDQRVHDDGKKKKKGKKKKGKEPSPPPPPPDPGGTSPPPPLPPTGTGCSTNEECRAHGPCAACAGGQCTANSTFCKLATGNICAECDPASFTCVIRHRRCGDLCVSLTGCCSDDECNVDGAYCAVCRDGECRASDEWCKLNLGGVPNQICAKCHPTEFHCFVPERLCEDRCIPFTECCDNTDCGECGECELGRCLANGQYCVNVYDDCHACAEDEHGNYACVKEGRPCGDQCLPNAECCPGDDSVCHSLYGECALCQGGDCLPDDGVCQDAHDPCHACHPTDGDTFTCVQTGRYCDGQCRRLGACCTSSECGGECASCAEGECLADGGYCRQHYGPCSACNPDTFACGNIIGEACGDTCCEPCHRCTDQATGQCVNNCTEGTSCNRETGNCMCPEGKILCDGSCIDTNTSQNNCGGCVTFGVGERCGSCSECIEGACRPKTGGGCGCSNPRRTCGFAQNCGVGNNSCWCRQVVGGGNGTSCTGLVNKWAPCSACSSAEICVFDDCSPFPEKTSCARRCLALG